MGPPGGAQAGCAVLQAGGALPSVLQELPPGLVCVCVRVSHSGWPQGGALCTKIHSLTVAAAFQFGVREFGKTPRYIRSFIQYLTSSYCVSDTSPSTSDVFGPLIRAIPGLSTLPRFPQRYRYFIIIVPLHRVK